MAKQMDAIALLKDDHAAVKKLFREFEGFTERAIKGRQEVFTKIQRELQIHTKIEESIFYPAARGVTPELIPEALNEHDAVDRLLKQLDRMKPTDDEFDTRMAELIKDVEHHAGEEEKEMFPKVQKELGIERLRELGAQMMERKREMQQEMRRAA